MKQSKCLSSLLVSDHRTHRSKNGYGLEANVGKNYVNNRPSDVEIFSAVPNDNEKSYLQHFVLYQVAPIPICKEKTKKQIFDASSQISYWWWCFVFVLFVCLFVTSKEMIANSFQTRDRDRSLGV